MHNIYLAKTRCANLGATVLGAIVSRDVVTVTMFVTLASFVAWFRFDFGDDDIFFPYDGHRSSHDAKYFDGLLWRKLVQSLNLLTPPKLCTFCVLFIRKGLFAAFAIFSSFDKCLPRFS